MLKGMKKKEQQDFGNETDFEDWERGQSELGPVRIPITGTLDLHAFRPDEVHSLIGEYLSACLEEEIYELRIIHGKGKGVLRRIVHSILAKHPSVVSFGQEKASGGSWGATIVQLERES